MISPMTSSTTDRGEIHRRRIEAGFSQADLAYAAGLDRSAVSLIEAGKREGHPATLKALADALGCQVTDLVHIEAT